MFILQTDLLSKEVLEGVFELRKFKDKAANSDVCLLVSLPISASLGLQNAVTPSIETVQYRRGWGGGYRGWGGGYRYGGFGGAGLGLAAGAIIGGAIIGATQPYGYGYPGYGYPGYGYPGYGYPGYGYSGYGPGYAYAPGSQVAYCQQRFRSYDPGSGTYLGFDGLRHPCP